MAQETMKAAYSKKGKKKRFVHCTILLMQMDYDSFKPNLISYYVCFSRLPQYKTKQGSIC